MRARWKGVCLKTHSHFDSGEIFLNITVNQYSRGRHLSLVDVTLKYGMAVIDICEMLCKVEFLRLERTLGKTGWEWR